MSEAHSQRTPLAQRSAEQLAELRTQTQREYDALVARGLTLDITRGKPSLEQLDMSSALLELPGPTDYTAADGTDVRNYGGQTGLVELREIFGELLGIPVDQLLAQGNASLELMYHLASYSMLHGVLGSEPWAAQQAAGKPIKFLAPAPGYDRHFALSEALGIELVPVEMHDDGPDLASVTDLAGSDPQIKGIWVVPAYSNPSGAIVSELVARTLVEMPTAAADFRIYWDNAYGMHPLFGETTPVLDILGMAAEAGNPNRPFVFASTSKMTFAGAGVAFLGASSENLEWYLRYRGASTIGPDKINQLRHARFFGDAAGVRQHMERHRAVLAPKFAAVERILHDKLAGYGIAHWTKPKGGYFVSLDVLDASAKRVVALAKDAGIALTPAGSAFPYGDDPYDRNIRLAPSFPQLEEVESAMDGVATCVLLATLEALAEQ